MAWVFLDLLDFIVLINLTPKIPHMTKAGSQNSEVLSVSLSVSLLVVSLEYVNVLPSTKTTAFRHFGEQTLAIRGLTSKSSSTMLKFLSQLSVCYFAQSHSNCN